MFLYDLCCYTSQKGDSWLIFPDQLPSSKFVPWLLHIYPCLQTIQVGSNKAVQFHTGVRNDRERLVYALDGFKVSPSNWGPIEGVFL